MYGSILLGDLSVRTRFPKELEEVHAFSPPRTGHVGMNDLRQLSLPRNWNDKLANHTGAEKLRVLLSCQLHNHFRLQRMVVGQNAASQGEVAGLVVQKFLREGAAELRQIAFGSCDAGYSLSIYR